MKIKLMIAGAILAFLTIFYLGSLYVAYNKGYNKHALEVSKEATEIIMGSHTDILVAAKEVKDNEKNIKMDEVCSAVWTFDLRQCVQE